MTVKELIKLLEAQPQENEVYLTRIDSGVSEDITDVGEDDLYGEDAPGVPVKATFIYCE
jgi:hypothetical protein